MEKITDFIFLHADLAPWFIFIGIIIAGINLPISIDILLVTLAFLTANYYPEKAYLYLFLFFLSCTLSAWISYSIGKALGGTVIKHRYLSRIITQKKLDHIQNFYDKWGPFAYIIGRWIPFGMRSIIFLSSGISKISFRRFALLDAVGCFIWCAILFPLFFSISQNYQLLLSHLKQLNFFIFIFFAVIALFFLIKKSKNKTPTK